MEHTQNTSSGERDLLLSVFAQLGKDGSGWAAVGVGGVMSNALMFIIYPGGKKGATQKMQARHFINSISIQTRQLSAYDLQGNLAEISQRKV